MEMDEYKIDFIILTSSRKFTSFPTKRCKRGQNFK